MRLFVAIYPTPDASVELARALSELEVQIMRQGVRMTRSERIHLTLQFIGDCSEPKSSDIESGLGAIVFRPLEMTTTSFGGFPSMARPKVVWLGLEAPGLSELVAEICARTGRPPMKELQPHLTFARVSPGSPAVGRALELAPSPAPIRWTANEFRLMETLPNGAHEARKTFPLTL